MKSKAAHKHLLPVWKGSLAPRHNLPDLMDWVKKEFSDHLTRSDCVYTAKMINSRFVTDSTFMAFCNEFKYKIEPLYHDSASTWDEGGAEVCTLQGVFKITAQRFTFIHSSLFFKSHHQKDEVAHFDLINSADYDTFVSFRNHYDNWLASKDQEATYIKIAEGESLPYEKDSDSWSKLSISSSLKSKVKYSIDSFLSSKDLYKKNNLAWKRGLLFYGPSGCGKSSCIKTIISSYNFRPVTVAPSVTENSLKEAVAYAEQYQSLLFFEDFDHIYNNLNQSFILGLLDSIQANSGMLIIGTSSSLSHFDSSINDRPSRFDLKFEFSYPDETSTQAFLSSLFKKSISEKDLKVISKKCTENKFSYAHLQELYISSMHLAINKSQKKCNVKDVASVVDVLKVEKEKVRGKKIKSLDEYMLDKKDI